MPASASPPKGVRATRKEGGQGEGNAAMKKMTGKITGRGARKKSLVREGTSHWQGKEVGPPDARLKINRISLP